VLRQVLIRVGLGLLTLWAVSALLFFAMDALPGDTATSILGPQADPESIRLLREELELDRPVVVRYLDWLRGFARGDLGVSGVSGRSVEETLGPRIEHTAVLSLATIVALIPLSILFGAFSAILRDRFFDHATATTTLLLISLPEFVVGNLLVLGLAIKLSIFPAVSLFDPQKALLAQPMLLVLPALTLLAASVAQTIRMIRATLLDVLESEFVQLARLKGVPERWVILRHALPNALAPVIQVIVLNIAWLLGGVVIVEVVFQYPGIGAEMAHAISNQDLPTLQAIGMMICASFIILNMLADLVVIISNPRLRRAA
jgi:peptide/nickel transport system permease protein